jgi:aryl-alcohol dehydrogenase-like predicted oxidoreductase
MTEIPATSRKLSCSETPMASAPKVVRYSGQHAGCIRTSSWIYQNHNISSPNFCCSPWVSVSVVKRFTVKYRKLGRTGFEVSEIGHGLWGMGGWTGSDDQQSLSSLQFSVDLGCTFFDTAWAYGDGRSDGLAGKVAAGNPDKRIYIASKVPPKNGRWPASRHDPYTDVFPREHVLKYADRIRQAIGTDRIDLLQFHVWDDSWINEREFGQTIEELKNQEIILAFGLSLNRWEPQNGIAAIRTGLVDCVQVIYNIFDQAPEDELFPVCRELNIGVIARVPLDEGSLGGKLTLDTRFPEGDWRASYFGKENLTKTVARVEKLKKILPPGMSLPEMAFRFILSKDDVSTTIPGMRKAEHVKQNLAYSDLGPLPGDLLAELRKHRWNRKPKVWAA